jgi:hypothetical protein
MALPTPVKFTLRHDGGINLWTGKTQQLQIIWVNAPAHKITPDADEEVNEQQIMLYKCWEWPSGSWRPRRSGRRVSLRRVNPVPGKAPLVRILVPGKIYEGNCDGVFECDYHSRWQEMSHEQPVSARRQPI